MTAHRLPRSLAILAVLVLVALGILASGCTGIASPRGWASPVLSDDVLLVPYRDELLALELDSLEVRWAFPSGEEDDDIDFDTEGMLSAAYKNAVAALQVMDPFLMTRELIERRTNILAYQKTRRTALRRTSASPSPPNSTKSAIPSSACLARPPSHARGPARPFQCGCFELCCCWWWFGSFAIL